MPFRNTLHNLFISTQVTKELKIERLSPEWRPGVFSKYSTKFICFHKGHKRTENWKAFTWMAKGFSKYLTKCISIVRCSIPHPNQIYPSQSIPYPLIVHGATPVYDVLSVSKQVKREKIERPSPEGQPNAFSKYSTKCICFHTGHKRTEKWKAFTWMAKKCIVKILFQIYLFPHTSQNEFTWMSTKCLFKILYHIYLFPHTSQKEWKLDGFHLNVNQLPVQNTII